MYRGRGPCERARNTDSRFLPETSEVGPADLPRPHITAISPKRTIPDGRAVLWYRVLSDGMTLACGLIWVGYQKRMSCTTVLTSLTSSPIVTTSAIHATDSTPTTSCIESHGAKAGRVSTSSTLNVADIKQGTKSTRVRETKSTHVPVVAKKSSVRQISFPRSDAQRRPRVWAGKGLLSPV